MRGPVGNYTLKAACRRLVRDAGGQGAAAAKLGISPSRIQQLLDPTQRAHLDVRQVLTLEQDCGEMIVTGFLAHEQGAVVMRLLPRSEGRLNLMMARIGSAIGHFFGAYEAAVGEDGTLSPDHAGDLLRNIDDAMSRLAELRAAIQRRQ